VSDDNNIMSYTKIVSKVNEICSIIEQNDLTIVGIKRNFTPESIYGPNQMVSFLLNDGTISLLEKEIKNVNPGNYIGIYQPNEDGCYTYTFGYEVKFIDILPDGLPDNTCTEITGCGMYARIKNNCGSFYNTGEYFTGKFYKDTSYVYDEGRESIHRINSKGELISADEPIKAASSPDEKYNSVKFKIVSLPPLIVLGIKTDTVHGKDLIYRFFSQMAKKIDSIDSRRPYLQDYIGYSLCENGIMSSFFGGQVINSNIIISETDYLTIPGGLYVKVYQKEINNDNPVFLSQYIQEKSSSNEYPYIKDETRQSFIKFHQGHSASVFFPIKNVEDQII
jgi:hypothetical protein